MEHPIVVREVNDGPDAHDEHVRREGQVALIEDNASGRRRLRRVRGFEPDDRVDLGAVLRQRGPAHFVCGVSGRRTDARGKEPDQKEAQYLFYRAGEQPELWKNGGDGTIDLTAPAEALCTALRAPA